MDWNSAIRFNSGALTITPQGHNENKVLFLWPVDFHWYRGLFLIQMSNYYNPHCVSGLGLDLANWSLHVQTLLMALTFFGKFSDFFPNFKDLPRPFLNFPVFKTFSSQNKDLKSTLRYCQNPQLLKAYKWKLSLKIDFHYATMIKSWAEVWIPNFPSIFLLFKILLKDWNVLDLFIHLSNYLLNT